MERNLLGQGKGGKMWTLESTTGVAGQVYLALAILAFWPPLDEPVRCITITVD